MIPISTAIRYFVFLALLHGCAARAAERLNGELLVFDSAQAARTPDYQDTKENGDGLLLTADVLLSLQYGQFRLFGEYLATNREHDLERLQLGWEPTADTTLWVGRYHQPASIWNHEHHHGQFVQTSITRPAIEDWEDDGGVIPQHYVGALLESRWHLPAGGALLTAVGAGYTATLTRTGLEPFDGPEHRLGFQARVALLANELSDSAVGILFAKGKIEVDGEPHPVVGLGDINQSLVGVYGNYASDDWNLVGAAYRVEATLISATAPRTTSSFAAGYVQLERQLPHALRAFARHEFSVHASESAYVMLFSSFPTTRTSLGARWDFTRRQALTVEASDTYTRTNHFGELRVQWSAALL